MALAPMASAAILGNILMAIPAEEPALQDMQAIGNAGKELQEM